MKPQAELHMLIDQITEFVLDLVPEARVEYERVIYEGEDANLTVYPPLTWNEDQCDLLQTAITTRSIDIHLSTGYLLLVRVHTPEEQVEEAKQELVRLKTKMTATEKILAEAAKLGLLKPNSVFPELVPA